jgi:hypothetical protein
MLWSFTFLELREFQTCPRLNSSNYSLMHVLPLYLLNYSKTMIVGRYRSSMGDSRGCAWGHGV